MTGLCFYGVRPAGGPAPDTLEAAAPGAFALSLQELQLILAPQSASPTRTQARMLDHHRFIVSLAQESALLPARYGAAFEGGVEHARAWANARRDGLRKALDLVSDCVELGVRLTLTDDSLHQTDALTTQGPGSAFLHARRAAAAHRTSLDARLDAAARALRAQFATTARASQMELRPGPAPLVVGAFLVPAETWEDVKRDLTTAAQAHAGLALQVNGPFPPYSFARLDEDACDALQERAAA